MKIIFFSLAFILFKSAKAQNDLGAFVNKIVYVIERSVPIDSRQYKDRNSSFFIIDIKINDSSRLNDVNYYGKPDGNGANFIGSAVDGIKKEIFSVNTKYKRILVPVYIIFSEDHPIFDYPFFKENVSKKGLRKNTFCTADIVIAVSDPMR